MADYYKRFMEAVIPASGEDTDVFIAGVQVVIWGSLYAEAQVNKVSLYLLGDATDRHAKRNQSMWKLAERAEIDKKVEALGQMFEDDEARMVLHLKELKRLVRIRNRLVHYKEMPTEADASLLLEEIQEGQKFGKVMEDMTRRSTNPDIVHAVLSMPLDDRRGEINSLCDWLASLKRN